MTLDQLPDPEALNRDLRAGKLPQMVDWFDPLILGMVAIRSLISTTIGAYADQRPAQAAADGEVDPAKLAARHDFSKRDTSKQFVLPPDADPDNLTCSQNGKFEKVDQDDTTTINLNGARCKRRLPLDNDGAFWVDFIADLGDGFEATYAMAYLLGQPKLELKAQGKHGTLDLPAGQILIFGGDMAYPNATLKEYRDRCLNPYNWAFTADRLSPEPRRELFFVAGNHDWYDGLASFSQKFCYEASALGGWRCRQERSYFAIRLPDDWWIWGIDVALGDSLDIGQVHYFQAIVQSMDERLNPKIVILLHAPDWTKPEYMALTAICELARQKGEICAILAGDLHHYSHYVSFGPDEASKSNTQLRPAPLHLITSGGGGAFAHPTHDRDTVIEVSSAVVDRRRLEESGTTKILTNEGERFGFRATRFYPSKARSRLLALRNLWLPLHNRRFAALMGVIYFVYAWVFHASQGREVPTASSSWTDLNIADAAAVATAARTNPAFFFLLAGLWLGLVIYVDANMTSKLLKWLNLVAKAVLGTIHFKFHVTALLLVDAISTSLMVHFLNPLLGRIVLQLRVWQDALLQSTPLASDANAAVLADRRSCLEAFDWPARQTWSCITEQPDAFYIGLTALTYAVVSILLGGLIGAFIFGCYWVFTSVLFGMHQDAFSALSLKDYKNFLRIKVEKDKLTIYPIGLDKVPDRFGWRPRKDEESPHSKPLLVPTTEMSLRLIEDPIEIMRADKPGLVDNMVTVERVFESLGHR